MTVLYGIAAATAALLLAALLAALLRAPALRLGLVERRQRRRRVGVSGGVAVVVATCAVVGAGEWSGAARLGEGVGGLLWGACAVALLGLAADLRRLKFRFLVLGTGLAAALVVPYGELGLLGGLFCAGWVTFVALAFRSLDHADGVAGTVGVVTAFGVGACAAVEVMDGPAVLLSVLAAALTGFLMHNWPHARVGLGTGGALFTGFLLASAAVVVHEGHEPLARAGVLIALSAVAGLDVLLVAVSRRIAGRALLRTSPDHLAHRLRRLGITAQGTVVLIGGASFGSVLVAVLAHAGWAGAAVPVWAVGVLVLLGAGLLRVRVYGVADNILTRGGPDTRTRAAADARPRRPAETRRRPAPGPRTVTGVPQAPQVTREQQVNPPRQPESSQVRAGLRVRNG